MTRKSFYVDDCLKSVPTDEEVISSVNSHSLCSHVLKDKSGSTQKDYHS